MMVDDLQACEEVFAEEVEAPSGWRCANPECCATTASKRRGPNKEFCSRNRCKDLAAIALANVKGDAKDKLLDELRQRVRDQATEIALLKQQLARAQAVPTAVSSAAKPTASAAAGDRRPLAALSTSSSSSTAAAPPAKKAKAAAPAAASFATAAQAFQTALARRPAAAANAGRQPLGELSANAQRPAAAQQPAKQVPWAAVLGSASSPASTPAATAPSAPAAASNAGRQPLGELSATVDVQQPAPATQPAPPPVKQAWYKAGRLPHGWSKHSLQSRPGEYTYRHAALDVELTEPPTLAHPVNADWQVQPELIRQLIGRFSIGNEGRNVKVDELYSQFEMAVQLKPGSVRGVKSLRQRVTEAQGKALDGLQADHDALRDWIEDTEDDTGRDVSTFADDLAWDERRLFFMLKLLEARGDIYTTIDRDHYAVTAPAESPPSS